MTRTLALSALAAIALAATAFAQDTNQVPLSSLTIVPAQPTIAFSGSSGLTGTTILSCESSPDGFTVKNCKIGEGHTLDEAMTSIYMSMVESNRAYGRDEDRLSKIIKLQESAIKSLRKENDILTKELKEDQKAFQKMQDLFSPKGGPRT
jgi:hypothetical protein